MINSVWEHQICQGWRFKYKSLLATDGKKKGRLLVKVKFRAAPEKTTR